MRVRVKGDSDTARALRGYLKKSGHVALVEDSPDYTIHLEAGPELLFDSVDSDLERHLFRRVRELTETPVKIQTAGGIQSDQEVRIIFPPEAGRAVELGVTRGFAEFAGPKDSGQSAAPFAVSAPSNDSIVKLYERLIAEKDCQIQNLAREKAQLEARLEKAVTPWWKRIWG